MCESEQSGNDNTVDRYSKDDAFHVQYSFPDFVILFWALRTSTSFCESFYLFLLYTTGTPCVFVVPPCQDLTPKFSTVTSSVVDVL